MQTDEPYRSQGTHQGCVPYNSDRARPAHTTHRQQKKASKILVEIESVSPYAHRLSEKSLHVACQRNYTEPP